jgi:hypothetical protein
MEQTRYEQVREAIRTHDRQQLYEQQREGGAAILSVAASSHESIRYEHEHENQLEQYEQQKQMCEQQTQEEEQEIYSVCLYKSLLLKN